MSLAGIAKYAAATLAGGATMVGAIALTNRLICRTKTSHPTVVSTDNQSRQIPLRSLAVAKQMVSQRDWEGCMRTPTTQELIENCSDELFDALIGVERSIEIDHISPHERLREFEDRTYLVMHDIIDQHVKADLAEQARIVNTRMRSAGSTIKQNRSIAAVA